MIYRELTIFAFFLVLFCVAYQDFNRMKIANGCHIALAVLAIISIFTMPEIGIFSRLAGMLCTSVPFFILTRIVPGSFGFGDLKLMAAGGLFLGWEKSFLTAGIAVLTAGFYCLYLLTVKKAGRKARFPFGPFLCLGMAFCVCFGDAVISWWIR